MFTSRSRSSRRLRRGSLLLTPLALAATAALAATPVAGAQSTMEADGTIAVSSLDSSFTLPAGSSELLDSLASPAYAEYVALGDSFAAWGNQDALAVPPPCSQSETNYPKELDANLAVGELTDVTCGGAVTSDMFSERHEGFPPQLDALTADTDLVTLSIGGNDIHFSDIVLCILSGTIGDPVDCSNTMGDQVAADLAATYGADGPVDDIYDAIADTAPDATVIATQYMPLMPTDDADAVGCDLATAIGQDNLDWAREITDDINEAVAAAAERNGHVAVMPTSDIDRSGCAPADQRWTAFSGVETDSGDFHPTPLGQEAMAAAIAAEL